MTKIRQFKTSKSSGYVLLSAMISITLGSLILATAIQSMTTYSKVTALSVKKTRAYYTALSGNRLMQSALKTALTSNTEINQYISGGTPEQRYEATITISFQDATEIIYKITSTGYIGDVRSTVESFYSVIVNEVEIPADEDLNGASLPPHCLNGRGVDHLHSANCVRT